MNKQFSRFISLEGIEGAGKSTQAQLLKNYFKTQGLPYLFTREPGGTPFGKVIRDCLLERKNPFQSIYTELLLFTADRLEHIEQVIRPALAAGKIVVCDRFFDSTIAYQQGGRRIDPAIIQFMQTLIPLKPDLTFLYDLDPEIGLSRAKSRGNLDAFEKEELDFHHRVRNQYLEIANAEPARVKVLDVGHESPEIIFKKSIGLITSE